MSSMRPAVRDVLANARSGPDRDLALERYRTLAPRYDGTTRHAERIRHDAIEVLTIAPGETVVDVACGSGLSLPGLAARVGPTGHVIGIDQCPHMIALATARAATCRGTVQLIRTSADAARLDDTVDAYLFCFTHDVLQSDGALANLMRVAKPGARVAVAGLRLLPWWWATPINLWNLYRSSCYFTTYNGLRQPWRLLLPYSPNLALMHTYWFGAYYVAVGVVTPKRIDRSKLAERDRDCEATVGAAR